MARSFLHPLSCYTRSLAVAMMFALSTGTAWSEKTPKRVTTIQDEAINLIVTSDSPKVKMFGEFRVVDGYLARSGRVFRSASPKASARYTPDLPRAGSYEVYAWWPQRIQGAGQVSVTVLDAAGRTSVTLNQSEKGGQWHLMGVFEAAERKPIVVTLRGSPDAALVVDALRFDRIGTARPDLEIEPARLPAGTVDTDYRMELRANGRPPFVWSLLSGTVPEGVKLDSTTGVLSGRAADPGQSEFVVEVRDASGRRTQRSLKLEMFDSENSR